MKKILIALLLVVSTLSSTARADREEAKDLRARARAQLFTAAVMMPLSSILVAGGAGLIVSGLCFDSCDRDPNGARLISGATLSAIGYGGIIASIPLLISGGREHQQADRMLVSGGVSPSFSRGQANGAMATVRLGF